MLATTAECELGMPPKPQKKREKSSFFSMIAANTIFMACATNQESTPIHKIRLERIS